MCAAVITKNKKKRKRPLAKDWPPTSAQKKNLVPYGSRPWKLPRLNEAPYVDIWMKIISYIKQENATRFRKFRLFRGVHHELAGATRDFRKSRSYAPLHIEKAAPFRSAPSRLYVLQDEYYGAPRGTIFILKWIPYSAYTKAEQLAWVCQWAGDVTPVTNLFKDQSKNIFRFTDIDAWESVNSAFLCMYKKENRPTKYWKRKRLEIMIRTAPKLLDRESAAIRVGILLEKYFPSSNHSHEKSVKNK